MTCTQITSPISQESIRVEGETVLKCFLSINAAGRPRMTNATVLTVTAANTHSYCEQLALYWFPVQVYD